MHHGSLQVDVALFDDFGAASSVFPSNPHVSSDVVAVLRFGCRFPVAAFGGYAPHIATLDTSGHKPNVWDANLQKP